jgi:SAM-dependent methyltransferase
LVDVDRQEAEEWNQRYQKTAHHLSQPRTFLEEIIDLCPTSGWALDVATGEGHNAGLLAKRGMNVLGVDFSRVALRRAQQKYTGLNVALVHLPTFRLKTESLQMILNFWFLDRNMFPLYRRWLKPGGLFLFESMRFDPKSDQSHLRPEYLVQPGELRKEFLDWEFLVYDENVEAKAKGKTQLAVRLLARKPLKD